MGVQDERAGTRRGAEVGDLGPNQALIERLLRLGASVEEIDAAAERGGLQALTIEILLAPDRHLTIGEVATRAEVTTEDALRLWRAWGSRRLPRTTVASRAWTSRWSAPPSRSKRSSGRDASFHTARVMGMAVGRIAESEVAMLRSALEAPLRERGASEDEVLASYEATIGDMIGMADAAIATLHRHHLVETVRRQMDWGVEANATNVLDIVVGFADLTDSTRLVAELALDELDHALAVFEERTADIIAGRARRS